MDCANVLYSLLMSRVGAGARTVLLVALISLTVVVVCKSVGIVLVVHGRWFCGKMI